MGATWQTHKFSLTSLCCRRRRRLFLRTVPATSRDRLSVWASAGGFAAAATAAAASRVVDFATVAVVVVAADADASRVVAADADAAAAVAVAAAVALGDGRRKGDASDPGIRNFCACLLGLAIMII